MMQSCRLARRSARKHTREMTKCGLIYLALLTVWCALAALSRALPALPRVLGLGYLFGAIGLGMNAFLLRAVSPPEREIRLNKRAWTLLLILPLLYLPPLAGLCALLRFADVRWQSWLAQLLAGSVSTILLALAIACAVLWVFCLLGAFARLAFLRALRSDKSITPKEWASLAARALRHSLAPALLFLRYIHFFLLAAALWLALEAAAGLLAGTFALQADLPTTALLFLAHLLTPHPWLSAAAFALGPVWMLGLGVYFWPRFQLARVCYFYRAGK
mgnify:FL=1